MGLLQQKDGEIRSQKIKEAMIEGRNIDLDHVTIIDDLSLTEGQATNDKSVFEEPKRVASKIRFHYCRFKGAVDLSKSTFLHKISFAGSRFEKGAVFLGAYFRDKADFSSGTIFSLDAQFDDARFYETPWFYDCRFKGNAKFENVTFYQDAIFSHSRFKKNFNLTNSKVGCIYFERFEAYARLKSEARIGIADIININNLIARLNNKRDDVSAYINDKIEDNTVKALIRTFNPSSQLKAFDRVKFLDEFNRAIFDETFLEEKPFQISELSGTTKSLMDKLGEDPRVNRLIIEDLYPDLIARKRFLFGIVLNNESHIYLNGLRFNQFQLHWHVLKKNIHKETMASFYLALIKSYHELGWTSDEDNCYFDYRSKFNKNKISNAIDKLYNKLLSRINLSKFIDPISSISCGYGVYPGRTLSLGLMVILAFASLYWAKCTLWLGLGGDGLFDRSNLPANVTVVQLANDVFQTMYQPGNHLAGSSLSSSISEIPNALYLSAMIFFSQVPSNWYVNGYWKYVVMFERITGWLLMALFIVVLTKKLLYFPSFS